eukprot:153664-Chlamydomonas_euryale.AAC.1
MAISPRPCTPRLCMLTHHLRCMCTCMYTVLSRMKCGKISCLAELPFWQAAHGCWQQRPTRASCRWVGLQVGCAVATIVGCTLDERLKFEAKGG